VKYHVNITWIAVCALVLQATCGGCHSRTAVQFASNTADIFTGPSLNHTEETVDQFKNVDPRDNGYQSGLSAEFLAPPVTFDSDLPQTARPMSLEDAIHLAFNNTKAIRSLGAQILSNPTSVQSALDPAINATDPVFGVDAALAQFDANLSASLIHANNDNVFNNSILGGGATEVVQDLTTADLQINKTNIYGTQYNVRSNIRYDNNDNISSTFPSSYSTFWEATARQPLLQGSGFAFNQIAGPNNRPGFRNTSGIAIARINNKISQARFEQGVVTFIDEVISAYWGLYFAYRNFDTTRTARDGSLETWNVVKAKFDNGLPGGEADKEAQAREQFYQFQQQTVLAFNGDSQGTPGVLQAEANLRRLLGLPQSDGTIIRPTEQPFMGDVAWEWNSLLSDSLSNRTEIQEQLWRLKQRELELFASKNFLQPRLDGIATFRNNGFGDRLVGGDSRFSSALTDSVSGDHNEWELGVTLDVPIGYRQAWAGVRNSELKVIREKNVLIEQEKQIAHELGSAIRGHRLAFRSAQLAHNRMRAAQDTYGARQAAFEADGVTVDLLLDAVRRMAEAQNQFDRAQVDLQLATEAIFRQSGGLLANHAVSINRSDLAGNLCSGSDCPPSAYRRRSNVGDRIRSAFGDPNRMHPLDYRF
jgi:outer membrane protein TolC